LRQFEYYFSKENLDRDEYLSECPFFPFFFFRFPSSSLTTHIPPPFLEESQMNAEMYVPIATIAGFKMVKQLSTDITFIVEVLKTSKELLVHENGELVRPIVKAQRSTLILRDIKPDVPVADVEAIFKTPGCAPFKRLVSPHPVLTPTLSSHLNVVTFSCSIKPDIGNTWFVAFENEDEALKTLEVIKHQSFNGNPVQARVKSESPLK